LKNLLKRKRRAAKKANKRNPKIRGISRSSLSPPECPNRLRKLKVASTMK